MGCIVFLTLACTAIDLEPLRLEHLCPPFFLPQSLTPTYQAISEHMLEPRWQNPVRELFHNTQGLHCNPY